MDLEKHLYSLIESKYFLLAVKFYQSFKKMIIHFNWKTVLTNMDLIWMTPLKLYIQNITLILYKKKVNKGFMNYF